MEGKVEVIHSFTPELQLEVGFKQLANMNLDYISEEDDTGLVSVADKAAADRFGIIVSVVDTDGNIESSEPERIEELERLMFEAYQEFKAAHGLND
jgi:hypothetical protein